MPASRPPRSLAAITPAWLGGVLAPSGRVVRFEAEPIGEGAGLVGVVNRLRLEWSQGAAAGPQSVIVKLASAAAGARLQARRLGHYEKEVGFYRDLARQTPVRTPEVYFAGFDPARQACVLVLEDIRGRGGNQFAGFSEAEVTLAVETLADLHARWWRDPTLDSFAWLLRIDRPRMKALQPLFARAWPRYRAFAGGPLRAGAVGLAERLVRRLPLYLADLARRPATLIHGDFRGDNLIFGEEGSRPAVLDWQLVQRGPGAHDVAYLLVGNLPAEARRRLERPLLRLWLARLRAAGVTGYGEAEAWLDYRAVIPLGWVWTVIGIGTLDLGSPRASAVFRAWSDRLLTAMAELQSTEAMDALAG